MRGVIYSLNQLNISSSKFSSNTANTDDGAIFATGSNILNILNSRFESNRAKMEEHYIHHHQQESLLLFSGVI